MFILFLGLIGLLKKGWNEIPEVVSTTGFLVIRRFYLYKKYQNNLLKIIILAKITFGRLNHLKNVYSRGIVWGKSCRNI